MLIETHMLVRFLKETGAPTWILDAVLIEKQRAYAQRIQASRPASMAEWMRGAQTADVPIPDFWTHFWGVPAAHRGRRQ